MAREWTQDQKSAIETFGSDILVSAGAGSGKTAVLTERIIRRLTDEKNPAEITRMLVVTFTKAAASELKERIAAAIEDKLAENQKNKRLARQLLSLDRAKICTIHSFCLDVLKEYADSSVLPSDFRIADETEIALLRKSLMNNLLDELYSGLSDRVTIPDFENFADMFVGAKSDSELADVFLGIEESLSSFPEYIEFIRLSAERLSDCSEDFIKTPYAEEILSHVTAKFQRYRDIFEGSLSEITSDEKLNKAYYTSFTNDIDFIDRVIATANGDIFENISKEFADFAPVRLGAVKKSDISPELTYAKDMREEFHKTRKTFEAKYFSLTSDGLKANRLRTADALMKLYELLRGFCERFAEEKRNRSIVDYGDLERLTYELLAANGAPTETALAVRDRFDEIYIDEYQDVNAIQDALFAAVSKGNNRFMVGDIKQSIYSFRGSAPQIFADYRRRFTSTDNDEGKAIFLSANFRCDENIIILTNIVSLCLFTSGRGDVDFRQEDMLVHKKIDNENGEPVRILLIDGSEENTGDNISTREAAYIAKEAARLIKEGKKNDGSPIRPSDIAVLMRSTKAHANTISDEFDRVGIPYYNSVTGEFFENAEVLLALCLLNIIDNPTRDIYLAGALRSPVFAFSLSELIEIRKFSAEGCLYEALIKFSEANNSLKVKNFVERLELWRQKAAGMRIDRLLWYIYSDTDLLALVYDKENATRRANLMLLYEYARRFESSSFKGLYNFIRYINDILEQKEKLETAKVFGESGDTVKLMSIHQSKGLEFPVCFICGTGKKFNDSDSRRSVVMDRELGISLKLSDETGFARYDTIIRQAILKRISDNQLEEEMRILYVAMTRARERLYITALSKDPARLLDSAYSDSLHLSKDLVMKNGGYMKWILTAIEHYKLLNKDAALPCTIEIIKEEDDSVKDNIIPAAETPDAENTLEEATDYSILVKERFDFSYPTPAASRLPAKLSVSKLYPDILDTEYSASLKESTPPYRFDEKRPLFLENTTSDLQATGAERGTATHVFMQFCNFSEFSPDESEEIIKEKIKEEALRLTSRKFITARGAELVNVSQVSRFFKSEIFREIKASSNIWREKRFNVRLPAANFTSDTNLAQSLSKETILVQGVIDCFYENSDGTLTLLDYKTDYIPRELSEAEAAKLLLERHSLQLNYYRQALEKISMQRVARCVIYSFGGGFEIDL